MVFCCMDMCASMRVAIQNMCVHTFSAILSRSGIVNSLLSKLLNGVTTRAKAFSSSSFFFFFLFFCIYFLSLSHPLRLWASWPQVGRLAISILFFILEVVADERYMWTACIRLWKGLTLPFDSTSVPHRTGKATVRLVDYPSHSQMPSNDYLATLKMQCQGPSPGSAVQSQWRPDEKTSDLINLCWLFTNSYLFLKHSELALRWQLLSMVDFYPVNLDLFRGRVAGEKEERGYGEI